MNEYENNPAMYNALLADNKRIAELERQIDKMAQTIDLLSDELSELRRELIANE